eukprot:1313750-Rhodomonas_salina.1
MSCPNNASRTDQVRAPPSHVQSRARLCCYAFAMPCPVLSRLSCYVRVPVLARLCCYALTPVLTGLGCYALAMGCAGLRSAMLLCDVRY